MLIWIRRFPSFNLHAEEKIMLAAVRKRDLMYLVNVCRCHKKYAYFKKKQVFGPVSFVLLKKRRKLFRRADIGICRRQMDHVVFCFACVKCNWHG